MRCGAEEQIVLFAKTQLSKLGRELDEQYDLLQGVWRSDRSRRRINVRGG